MAEDVSPEEDAVRLRGVKEIPQGLGGGLALAGGNRCNRGVGGGSRRGAHARIHCRQGHSGLLGSRGASLEDKFGRRRAGFEFAGVAHGPRAAVEADEAFGVHGEGKQHRPRTLRVRDHRVYERDPLRQFADVQLAQALAVKDENGDCDVVPARHLGEESAVVR